MLRAEGAAQAVQSRVQRGLHDGAGTQGAAEAEAGRLAQPGQAGR